MRYKLLFINLVFFVLVTSPVFATYHYFSSGDDEEGAVGYAGTQRTDNYAYAPTASPVGTKVHVTQWNFEADAYAYEIDPIFSRTIFYTYSVQISCSGCVFTSLGIISSGSYSGATVPSGVSITFKTAEGDTKTINSGDVINSNNVPYQIENLLAIEVAFTANVNYYYVSIYGQVYSHYIGDNQVGAQICLPFVGCSPYTWAHQGYTTQDVTSSSRAGFYRS